MYQHKLHHLPNRSVYSQWFLLSLNAGFINAGGFLATGRFVSHVTGFATLFGVDIAAQQFDLAVGILSVPFFFLLGSMIAGVLIERPLDQKRVPHYDYVMSGAGLCLLISSVIENFDQFGGSHHLKDTYILMALLCLASGLQNAAIAASSQSSVRTTHLTGLTTDLGLGLARVLTSTLTKVERKREAKINWLRVGTIASFVVGSGLGAYIFKTGHYFGFTLPASICFYSAWHGRRLKASAEYATASLN